MKTNEFLSGMRAGIPVCIGYFSVSFGFGAMAISKGLKAWYAILISATNLTSAGQFAGLEVITAGATIIELILTQIIINSRYSLMSVALSQKFGTDVGTGKRLIASFFNTDEIFALSMARKQPLTASFFVGAGCIASLGWISGTALGAFAGSILSTSIRAILGIMLYGMFIAIVVPEVKKAKPIFITVIISIILSSLFTWAPYLNKTSTGLAIVICTVVSSAICAVRFPLKDEVSK